MKPTFKTKMLAMHPKNNYKFREYSVEVFKHAGRQMKIEETNFISSVQHQTLEGVALILCKWQDQPNKLELIRIAMQFHIYRNYFDEYLKNNKNNPKVKRALELWKAANSSGYGTFKA